MAGTNLEVQLGAKLADFEHGMDQAVSLAERAVNDIESRFSNLNPSVGAGFLSAGIIGAVGGMSALLGFAGKVNSELAEMDRTARQVGLTVEKFQALRFAANVGGVDNAAFAEGLQKSVGLLNDAQRNANTLGQLFAANGLKIEDSNKKLISTNQLLANAASLISRAASEQDKIKIAAMLGFTREWVPLLEKGAGALSETAGEAERLGLVIQQSTIDKAKRFDEEWSKASTSLSTQLRAATADAAVWLSELIDQATRYVAALAEANGGGSGSGQERFNAIADAVDIVRRDVQGLAQDYDQVTRALERYKAKAGADPEIIAGLEEVQKKAKAAADELNLAAKARAALLAGAAAEQFPGGVPLPGARPKSRLPATVVPAKPVGEETDAFEQAEEQIKRRTAALNADSIAVSQNHAVQAQLRAEFQLLNAIRKDEGEVTQEQLDRYTKLRETMGAELALIEAKIKLTPEHKAAFIAASEGAAIATANYDRARDAVTRLNSASATLGSALSTAFADAIVDGKNLNDVLNNLLKTIEKAAINSVFASVFNAPASGGLSPFASIMKSIIPGFAGGTDYAPGGPAWVGERGPELVNLPRGSQVIPNAIARRMGGSAGVTVNLVEDSSRAGQTQKRDNNSGGFDLTVFVDQITARNIGNPGSATRQTLGQAGRVASR